MRERSEMTQAEREKFTRQHQHRAEVYQIALAVVDTSTAALQGLLVGTPLEDTNERANMVAELQRLTELRQQLEYRYRSAKDQGDPEYWDRFDRAMMAQHEAEIESARCRPPEAR